MEELGHGNGDEEVAESEVSEPGSAVALEEQALTDNESFLVSGNGSVGDPLVGSRAVSEQNNAGGSSGAEISSGDEGLLDLGTDLSSSSSSSSSSSDGGGGACEVRVEFRKKERLAYWYQTYHKRTLSQACIRDLLTVLREEYDEMLPVEGRTLLTKVKPAVIEQRPNGGQYWHLGLDVGLVHLLRGFHFQDVPNGLLKIRLYVDGVSPFKNSQRPIEYWPILAAVSNVAELKDRVICIGIYQGTSKPVAEDLMSSCLDDYADLLGLGDGDAGLLLPDQLRPNSLRRRQPVAVELERIIADAPARQMLKAIKGHTGYWACEWCNTSGRYAGTQVVFSSKPGGFGADKEPVKLRTDSSFRRRKNEQHHKGWSVFLPFDVDMVYGFTLDTMHLLYLGVSKRWLSYATTHTSTSVDHQERVRRVIPEFSIRGHLLAEMKSLYATYDPYCPREFGRKPRWVNCKTYLY
jgi:hypothetical protein